VIGVSEYQKIGGAEDLGNFGLVSVAALMTIAAVLLLLLLLLL
jgi:hypothetical protein